MRHLSFYIAAGIVLMLAANIYSLPIDPDSADVLCMARQCSQDKKNLSPEQLAAILSLNKSDNSVLRMSVAYALQYSDAPAAKSELQRLATDKDERVQGVAKFSQIIKQAAQFKTDKAGEIAKKKFLFSEFAASTNQMFKYCLAIRLGDLYGNDVSSVFMKALKDKKNASFYLLRTELIFQLAMRGNIAQLKELREYVRTATDMDEHWICYDEAWNFFSNTTCQTLPRRPIIPYKQWVEPQIDERIKKLSKQ